MAKKKNPVYDYMVKFYDSPILTNSELNFISNGDDETDTKGDKPNATPWKLVSVIYAPEMVNPFNFIYYFIREL